MITLEDLKPILQPVLEGRDDAAEVIEAIQAVDKPEPVDRTAEIEALNEDWNNRFKEAFFGEKAPVLDSEPPKEPEKKEDEVDGDNITIDDLFKEGIIS